MPTTSRANRRLLDVPFRCSDELVESGRTQASATTVEPLHVTRLAGRQAEALRGGGGYADSLDTSSLETSSIHRRGGHDFRWV